MRQRHARPRFALSRRTTARADCAVGPATSSSSSSGAWRPPARSAYPPICLAEYEIARIRKVGSSADPSSSSSRAAGAAPIRRPSASATASRARSRRPKSGRTAPPRNVAALARRTDAVAARASAFSSRQRSSEGEVALGARNDSNQSSSSTREARAIVRPVGPVGRYGSGQEAPAQTVDCLSSTVGDHRPVAAWLRLRKIGQGFAGQRRTDAEGRARPRRPEQHVGADSEPSRERPAFQARRDLGERDPERHREDEHEQCRGRCRSEVAVDHPGEQNPEADDRHRPRREPGVPRAERPQDDARGAGAGQRHVGNESAADRAGKIDKDEDGERSERGEERRLRVTDQLVGDRKDGRHHDRRASRRLQRGSVRVGEAKLRDGRARAFHDPRDRRPPRYSRPRRGIHHSLRS